MSTGGLFKLITNDGKQDMMLMATSLLNQRLADIRTQRAQLGLDDTPNLIDIERTHVLFTSAHFKPFVAIGFEYNTVAIQTGMLNWGNEITFNIPQFGDFFADMVVAITLNQPIMVVGTNVPISDQPLMRWCSYPGERIFDKIKFEVNGNVLDDYHSCEVNLWREFNIAPNKLVGWQRMMGQEEEEIGAVDQPAWKNSGVASSAIVSRQKVQYLSGLQTPTGQKTEQVQLFVPLLFWFTVDTRLAIPSVAIPQGSRYIRMKLTSAENMVGLVPRGNGTWAEPYGTLNYANMLQSVQLYINNIFVNPEIHNIYIKRIGFTLIRVHRRQTFTTREPEGELQCQQLKWPIEFLYVAMKMADYNSSNAELRRRHLDKWHTLNKVVSQKKSCAGWLANKLYLVSSNFVLNFDGSTIVYANNNGAGTSRLTITAGSVGDTGLDNGELSVGDVFTLTPTAPAIAITNSLQVTVFSIVGGTAGTAAVITFQESVADAAAVWGTIQVSFTLSANNLAVGNLYRTQSVPQTSTVATYQQTLDRLGIKAHGIDIYQSYPTQFYSTYLPYVYGGSNLNTPQDTGACLINFALYPCTYQPSGHINLSRAREFYLSYKSSVIS